MAGLDDLQAAVIAFNADRDWQQHHTPRNLAAAISVEAGELLECYRWSLDGEATTGAPADEMADVLILLIALAHREGIDLLAEARRKLARNGERYPKRETP